MHNLPNVCRWSGFGKDVRIPQKILFGGAFVPQIIFARSVPSPSQIFFARSVPPLLKTLLRGLFLLHCCCCCFLLLPLLLLLTNFIIFFLSTIFCFYYYFATAAANFLLLLLLLLFCCYCCCCCYFAAAAILLLLRIFAAGSFWLFTQPFTRLGGCNDIRLTVHERAGFWVSGFLRGKVWDRPACARIRRLAGGRLRGTG